MTVPQPPVEVDSRGVPVIRCEPLPTPSCDVTAPPRFDPSTFPMPDMSTDTTIGNGG